jgi:hypothetical protein
VGLIDELPLGDPNSLGSDLVSQRLFDTQVEFIQNKQGLAHLPYKLSGRQPNKGIWQILLIRTQNLANLADINSKLGESCRYELKNLANLADMNSKLGKSCRYELKNLANLADMKSKLGEPCRYEIKTWRTLPL